MSPHEIRTARAQRAQVRILLDAGKSLSRVAKETGISYAHVKRMQAQQDWDVALCPDCGTTGLHTAACPRRRESQR